MCIHHLAIPKSLSVTVIWATLILTGIMGNTYAADDPLPRRILETTLWGGHAMGGSFDSPATSTSIRVESASVVGAAFNIESSDENAFYEFSYLRENSSLDATTPVNVSIAYLHLGGYVATTDDPKRIAPYFLATVGGTRFTPDLAGLEDVTSFSAAVGAGIRFPISRYFAVRLDGRVYATFVNGKSDLFCEEPVSSCAIQLEGKTLLRGIVTLGASVRF